VLRHGFVKLVHSETGAESQPVPESTVHIWEERGWVRADTPSEAPAAIAAGSEQIAGRSADEQTGPSGADIDPHRED
jgi:hypothetical protein